MAPPEVCAKTVTIKRLSPTDAIIFRRLRLSGLRENPTAFGSAYAEEAKYPLSTFVARVVQSPAKWVFGAFEEEHLVGVVSLVRDDKRKTRHKASIYGMYVKPKMRRQGIGRQLLAKTIDTARRMPGLRQVRLSVVETNGPALELYERADFKIYGREQDSLQVAGKYYAELFLAHHLCDELKTTRKH